jgi:hypothetical protein
VISMDEQKESVQEELKAGAGTTADAIKNEMQLIEFRKLRIVKKITDPLECQKLVTALEVRCCSLQSSLLQLG